MAMRKTQEKTEYLSTIPAPYNPREMGEHDYENLKASLQEYGVVQEVVVNKRTGEQGWEPDCEPVIVGGHQRVRAAAELQIVKMPVAWIDVDEVAERKLNLILNRVGGDWQRDMLERALRELKSMGDDLSGTGFTDDEIKGWLDEQHQEPPPEFPDATNETNHECPKCGYKWKT